MTKYIPHRPTPKQQAFLLLDCLEALYGGAAGGGKSDALLMGALQYVDVAGYAALILRRTYADLALPGAIMDRSHTWLQGTDAHWDDREKTWTFPAGATLTFGYLQNERDKYRYQSSEFQFIAFDELTQFLQSQYTYLFSRLRRGEGVDVPLRMRAASNPGGVGHGWVYDRFMPDLTPEAIEHRRKTGRIFIPAKLADNPHIDRTAYRESLTELDDVERRQLEEGLWVTDPAGKPFLHDWWRGANRFDPAADRALLHGVVGRWHSWDTATKDGEHNAFTALVQGELTADYRLLITLAWRDKLTVPFLAGKVRERAEAGNRDGKLEAIIIEDKDSGTGLTQTLSLGDDWLARKLVAFKPANYGDKAQRAQQAALWCKRGCVLLPEPSPEAPWLYQYEKELFGFPDVEFKDWTDATSQLVIFLEHYLAAGWRARGGGE
jgi:predicted phage terminase large subunit-like protein